MYYVKPCVKTCVHIQWVRDPNENKLLKYTCISMVKLVEEMIFADGFTTLQMFNLSSLPLLNF